MKMSKFTSLLALCLVLLMTTSACQAQKSQGPKIETELLPTADHVGDLWFTGGMGAFSVSEFSVPERISNDYVYALTDVQVYGPFDPSNARVQETTDLLANTTDTMTIMVRGYEMYEGRYVAVKTYELSETRYDGDYPEPSVLRHSEEESLQLLEAGTLDQWVEIIAAEPLGSFYDSCETLRGSGLLSFLAGKNNDRYAFTGRTITGPFNPDNMEVPYGFRDNKIYSDDGSTINIVSVCQFSEGVFVYEDTYLRDDGMEKDSDQPTTFVELSETEAEAYIADGFLAELGLTPDTLAIS